MKSVIKFVVAAWALTSLIIFLFAFVDVLVGRWDALGLWGQFRMIGFGLGILWAAIATAWFLIGVMFFTDPV